MKKLLLGSLALTMFSATIILFELSCKKTANAQSSTTSQITILDKSLITGSVRTQTGSTKDSLGRVTPIYSYTTVFYTVQNDGSNLTQINFTLPSGLYALPSARLTPDGKKMIFQVSDANGNTSLYSCLIDGSNVKKVLDGVYNLLETY